MIGVVVIAKLKANTKVNDEEGSEGNESCHHCDGIF
jgi:hypothetical protein